LPSPTLFPYPTLFRSIMPCQMHSPVQRDDRLARAGRTRDPRRPVEIALDQFSLRRMEKDRPFVPRIVERSRQFLDIAHYTEATLRVRMLERVGDLRGRWSHLWFAAGSKLQQRFSRLCWQMVSHRQERIFIGFTDIGKPLRRHSIA